MADGDPDEINTSIVFATASLAIHAGLSMTADEDGLVLPRRGWMAPPATGSPEVEFGAALAVQALVAVFDLDTEQVQRVAASLMDKAAQ